MEHTSWQASEQVPAGLQTRGLPLARCLKMVTSGSRVRMGTSTSARMPRGPPAWSQSSASPLAGNLLCLLPLGLTTARPSSASSLSITDSCGRISSPLKTCRARARHHLLPHLHLPQLKLAAKMLSPRPLSRIAPPLHPAAAAPAGTGLSLNRTATTLKSPCHHWCCKRNFPHMHLLAVSQVFTTAIKSFRLPLLVLFFDHTPLIFKEGLGLFLSQGFPRAGPLRRSRARAEAGLPALFRSTCSLPWTRKVQGFSCL